jgi:hypothetical protein
MRLLCNRPRRTGPPRPLAAEAVDRARAPGATVLTGRGPLTAVAQWSAAQAAVQPYLTALQPAPTRLLPAGAGASANLPNAPETTTVNGVAFTRTWYVVRCRQQGA